MSAGSADVARLPWPLFVIDFEASSLEPGSFPIEVGVVRWRSPAHPIEGWSTLIRPTPDWRTRGSWTAAAERVHGIRQDDLARGLSPAETVARLNAIIGPHAAFCDGGSWDMGWGRRLVRASGLANSYRWGDFDMLIGRLDEESRIRLRIWLELTPARHRAGDDAERLVLGLAHALGLTPVRTVALDAGVLPRSGH